ncbi:MAG: hypothetical protein WBQ69_10985 [Gallionella sp.]
MTTKLTAVKAAKRTPVKKSSVPAKPAARSATKAAAKGSSKRVDKKAKRVKVVRDSFTMPHDEYQKIAEIKGVCLKAKIHVKKSEVLRAGLKVLAGLDSARLKLVLKGLEKIKTGRPKKH